MSITSGVNALTGTTITMTEASGGIADISPYTGTLNQTVGGVTTTSTLTLYCDDLNNNAPVGSLWDINVSQITGNLNTTKFYSSNPTGVSGNLPGTSIPIPTGTTLYEEEAWLYTQMIGLSPGNLTTANVTNLQEAAWELTSNNLTSAERTNASPWLTAAYNAVHNGTATGSGSAGVTSINGYTLQTATYSKWFVFTDSTSANNSGPAGNQEFMAYYNSGTPAVTSSVAPEPATFWLLGSVMLLGGIFTRRKALALKA